MILWMMIEAAFERPCIGWIIALVTTLAALLAALGYYVSRNVIIYELTEEGYAFKPIAWYRITKRRMVVDLTRLRQYPDDWVLELKAHTAVKLKGGKLTIRTRERGDVVHKIAGPDSFGGYWFAIPPDAEDGDWE